MAEGYKDWSAGEVLTAADLEDYTVKQSTMRFATSAARDSALSAVLTEGLRASTADADREWTYTGATWEIDGWYSATGRIGGIWSRAANQSIPNTTVTDVSWDTEASDSDAFLAVTGATLTIPSGRGGIYIICARGAYASSTLNENFYRVTAGGTTWDNACPATTTGIGCITVMVALVPTNTIKVSLFHSNGGALNWTGNLWVFRMAA